VQFEIILKVIQHSIRLRMAPNIANDIAQGNYLALKGTFFEQ